MKIWIKTCAVVVLLAVYSCSDSPIIASVGDRKITREDFSKMSQRKAALLGVNELTSEQKRELLDDMVQREIVYLYASDNNIKIPAREWKEAVQGMPYFERFRKRKEIEKNLIFEMMKRNTGGYPKATEKEIKEYYRGHEEEYRLPERFKIYLVSIEPQDITHVRAKLNTNPGAFDDMALRRVSRELREINRNAPYAPKSDFPEEMWPYLEKMKVGEIAGPVKVKKGTFIFKLVDKKPLSLRPLSEVYAEIDHLVTVQKRDDAFETWYASIKRNYKVHIKEENL